MPSAIIERIEADYRTAFKAHQQSKVDALRLMKSALENAEIEARRDLTDEEVVVVLQKEAKKRREAIELYKKGNRDDKAATEQLELDEISVFLPQQMSDQDLESTVTAVVKQMNAAPSDFGKVMGAVMGKVKGQADGNRVSAAVKKILH